MSTATKLAALLLAGAILPSQASVITLQGGKIPTNSSGNATVTFQSSATAYRDTVTNLVTNSTTTLGTKTLTSWNSVQDAAVFGTNSNFAWLGTIDFGVTAAQAGNWSFRAGVDFGYGGALFLDGVALDVKSTDMWWNNSYANTSQFLAGTKTLAAGNHTLQIYGLEGCCDGGSQVQFKAASAAGFVSFGTADNLNVVPEPPAIAILGLGLGAMALLRTRRKGRKG